MARRSRDGGRDIYNFATTDHRAGGEIWHGVAVTEGEIPKIIYSVDTSQYTQTLTHQSVHVDFNTKSTHTDFNAKSTHADFSTSQHS